MEAAEKLRQMNKVIPFPQQRSFKQEIDDKPGVAQSLNSIGIIYYDQDNMYGSFYDFYFKNLFFKKL